MTERTKLPRLLLIALACSLAGCGSPDPELPVPAPPAANGNPVQSVTPAPAPTAVPEIGEISRERVLRAMTCQIVLSQSVGVAMTNADTGLPPDLAARLKVSAIGRWDDFSRQHAQATGVVTQDRVALVQSLNTVSTTAEERQGRVDIVRDCLDNEP